MEGYVYILEVKDILLPVSKVGMTTRTPAERLQEINNSATGDFLWEVAHQFYVNDCVLFERLIHLKLAPLRQKRREFFNLSPDDALIAIQSILESETDIRVITEPLAAEGLTKDVQKKMNARKNTISVPLAEEYAHWLDAFNEYFEVIGQPFGQLNKPTFGISDGIVGVQWNLVINKGEDIIELGVNLEGTEKMGGMLISDFLLSSPSISRLQRCYDSDSDITISIYREAWQAASRPSIDEKFIGGRGFDLNALSEEQWSIIVKEALTCLDKESGYKKRRSKQWVTLSKSGEKRQYDISPHLLITCRIDSNDEPIKGIEKAFNMLKPVRRWVVASIDKYRA